MRTLLFIEDDDSFRTTVARALKRRGWQVLEASDLNAVTEVISGGACPTAILLDMRLGEDDGMSHIQGLKARCPECRLVVLTGYGNIPGAMEALRLGADDYLLKPAGIEVISAALDGSNSPETERSREPAPSLARVEWEHIQRILHDCGGNISQAARLLGIDRRTLQRKLAKIPPDN